MSTSKDTDRESVPPFPSSTLASRVWGPSARVGEKRNQSPSEFACTVSVCSSAVPASSTRVTVAPGSAVPTSAGVASSSWAPSAGASMVRTTPCAVTVMGPSVAVFPARSTARTLKV